MFYKTVGLSSMITLLALTLPATAWSAAGKILFVTGEVFVITTQQNQQKLARGAEINEGDLIKTGPTGFTQVLMDDGGRLTLRAGSQLRITEFEYRKKSSGRSLMTLFSGSMRAVTGWIGHNDRNNYKIKTPTATIGIRGSDGNIGYSPEIGSAVQTIEGGHTLSYVEANGTAHTLDLNPGDVGLLAPNSVVPVKVKTFPFPTTQAATNSSNTKKLDVGITRTTPGPKTDLEENNNLSDGSTPTPGLQDNNGGVMGVNGNGQTEVIQPPPTQRVR